MSNCGVDQGGSSTYHLSMNKTQKITITGFSYFVLQTINLVFIGSFFVLSILFFGQESLTSYHVWEHLSIPKGKMPLLGLPTFGMVVMHVYYWSLLRKIKKNQ